jgi:hypothetical protein
MGCQWSAGVLFAAPCRYSFARMIVSTRAIGRVRRPVSNRPVVATDLPEIRLAAVLDRAEAVLAERIVLQRERLELRDGSEGGTRTPDTRIMIPLL